MLLVYLLSVLHAATALAQTVIVTVQPPIPSDVPQWASDRLFTSAVLNSTNTYRAEHNASDVTWNETLARFASAHLDDDDGGGGCDFEHSGGPYGENLAIGYPNVTASVEAWGDERGGYDFGAAEFSPETGHFTQLVWKDTTDVGCERRLCGRRGWYLACEYWPRGNVQGQFEAQVEPQEGGSSRLGPQRGALLACLVLVWCRGLL
ncbi:CAP domain-containing protein [Stachybotrys elegans]|uniref:CAP domain-containing protein n=1 Tax=Stachybotrys elegans TaxID=80388 RepID=A0A8K0SK46_9HYPO|nr:CAP domain-containing protein [Stachybotrys elegans]